MHVAVKSTMLFMTPSPVAHVYGSAATGAFRASLFLFLIFCSEVQTRNFSSPLDNNGSHNSSITDCTDAQASPSLGSPVQASSPSRKISNKGTGNIARKTSRIQDTLTQELREPSSSNDSDNDQSSPSTSLPHTCNSNQLRVCIVNFCSLVSYNKHLELYQLIDTHKPDIIIATETHLKSGCP